VSKPEKPLDELRDDVRSSWHRFLDVFEKLRPELYRYCRHLTRTPWDAEDLAQDALMRAFVQLGTMFHEVPNPRAWLFRVASNLWIDRVRRRDLERTVALPQPAEDAPEHRGPREVAGSILSQLAPQERAAVVLKDVFDFSLEEIADTLGTTPGAVKAALHRGRTKLQSQETLPQRAPARSALDAFCEAFNARDVDRLTSLLLDSVTAEIVGIVTEYGPDAPKDPHTGSFVGSMGPLTRDERGGIGSEWLEGYLGGGPRCEVRVYRDTQILLFWFDHEQGPMVRAVMTVDTEGDAIARLRSYFFTPDVVAEVCAEIGVPSRSNGYRYW
jgi:RNA polymerase sigma-70 factor (ECF subfamily)